MSEIPVCKRAKTMSDAAYVAEATLWAKAMVKQESRGYGDTLPAMQRLGDRHKLNWRLLWNLHYRPPKGVFAGAYFTLKAVYELECERQLRLLTHEIETTKAKAGPDARAVRAGVALVDAAADPKP